MNLGHRSIGVNCKPYIIAEMSGNHNGKIENALKIVDAAADAGVDALKIQTYTADTLTIDSDSEDFRVSAKGSLWKGQTLYGLYSKAYTPWEWHEPIFKHAKSRNLTLFSTPFDSSALDLLERLGCPFYKIASFENIHLPLIREVASKQKPILISTGMASLLEIEEAVTAVRGEGNSEVVLLKCTSGYPADPLESHLRSIPELAKRFGVEVGLSDHTAGIGVPIAAVALGATVIEKHMTLCRADEGVDAAFSLEPSELKQLVIETQRAWQALGQVNFEISEREKDSLIFRRSIYVIRDIAEGDEFNHQNIAIIRPGYGLHPRHFESLLGQKAKIPLKRGTRVSLECVKSNG